MTWLYRKIKSYRVGRWRFGYERRDYSLAVPIIVAWPRIWPVTELDKEET